ncbi:MAG: DegT/DnrJ/EryC1/StrS family aminotransferase [Candidatus Yanofskybacteria bacterium]|nr:DegT/DnrJ/EryC1/StrS family aminotransferase [Candidatus Yanofskybacteria bacterium]
MRVQFLKPYLRDSDIKEAVKALKSGWITYGSKTREFEEGLSKYLGVEKTIFNASGTAALHVALIAAGVGPGDEVITTPLSYVATSNVILYVGAKPVFVDVEPETGLMDLNKLERAITAKTKAVIPIHLYGQMVDMKRLKKISDRHGIKIIEDACHAIEAQRDGVRPGQLSFAACFSFHAAKNITCGEGGAVTANDEKLAEHLKLLCEGGVEKKGDKRFMVILGYKYSGTNFQAALLNGQLARIDIQWQKRKKIYDKYARAFKNLKKIKFPKQIPDSKHAYHMFIVWVDPEKRDEIRTELAKRGVQTSIHFNPIHLEPYYKEKFGYKKGEFPIAEKLGFSAITLPLYPGLTRAEQDFVVKNIVDSVK